MELKEAIKIISDFIKAMKPVFIVVNNDEINANLKKVEIEAFEIVLQALEKLQKENEKLKEIDLTTVHIKGVCDKKARWKNKIKEKIEELRRQIAQIPCGNDCERCFDKNGNVLCRGSEFDYCDEYYKIDLLQELLKGE